MVEQKFSLSVDGKLYYLPDVIRSSVSPQVIESIGVNSDKVVAKRLIRRGTDGKFSRSNGTVDGPCSDRNGDRNGGPRSEPPGGKEWFSYTPSTAAVVKATDFPKTAAAVQKFFPESDVPIVARIATAARIEHPGATDEEIAKAVITAHERDGKTQRKAALFVDTVPGMLRKLSEENKRKPPCVAEYSTSPTQCVFCGDTKFEIAVNDRGNTFAKPCRCQAKKVQA